MCVFIDDVLCTIMRQSFGIDMVPAFKGSGSSGLGRGFFKKKKKKKTAGSSRYSNSSVSKINQETSQQQCRCQLTPPCSIARFKMRWKGVVQHSCCGQQSFIISLVCWVLNVGMLVGVIYVHACGFGQACSRIRVRVCARHRRQ